MNSSKSNLSITSNGNIRLRIPMAIRRMHGRKMVFTPGSISEQLPDCAERTQPAAIKALARAFAWAELIESGKVSSIADLALRLKVSGSYITKIMKLTMLAPDIIESFLEGKEPDGLSLTQICATFPEVWLEQRKKFGYLNK